MQRKTVTALLCVPVAVGAGALVVMAGGASASTPSFNPANFHNPTANAYFPLTSGLVLRYRGTEDGVHFREVVRVTDKTKSVDGVTATVVSDVLRRADGSLAEKTSDFYADDRDGNVWYLGENTATYRRDGTLASREGSWQAGVNGATPGLIMPANPHATDAYRQEYLKGQAEDQAWIVQRGFSVRVPYGKLGHALRSFEWSRLEPGVVSVKIYAPGLGIVKERDMAGGNENFVLVSVSHG